jgi:sigma-B regulation protein RsbU (phosphoserine phosphatase)
MRRVSYTERSFDLARGDRLLLFTDGLPECRNGADELFGYERVTEVFERASAASPKEVAAALFDAADAFAAGRAYEDDVTVAVVGVL